jgi:hypothetical protein
MNANPNWGYQPFPYIPMPQQNNPPQQPIMWIAPGPNGKMPKAKSLAKQIKEFEEFQKIIKGDKPKEDKKGPPKIELTQGDLIGKILLFAIPVGAMELGLIFFLIRYVKSVVGL